jgi:DNA-directed RNA polymerase specialized sigma24 family protein
MQSEDQQPVTSWIILLKSGDLAAAQPLWEHYFHRLVLQVRARLPRGAEADEEDVALSAFNTFCISAAQGRFPRLNDRHDLWRLLVSIAAEKTADCLHRRHALKRGGRMRRLESPALDELMGREPTPEFALSVADELERLLHRLPDDKLRRVAIWKMEGYTNEEIRVRLGCALRTVANYLELIRKTWQAELAS